MGTFKIHRPSAVYAATSVASGLMGSVFSFYYVKVYLNLFHVSEAWFQTAQLLYLIWNAVNDPLFGYIQDNWNCSWVKSRRHSVLYGAPFYALAFILVWIPWGDYSQPTWLCGFQLLFVLCFYDTLLTFVLLAQCALFTEMSTRHEDRVRLVRYSQVGSLLGSTGVFFASFISHNLEDFQIFQVVCVILGIISYFCFRITGLYATSSYDGKNESDKEIHSGSTNLIKNGTSSGSIEMASWWTQTAQIFRQPNFIAFILVNLCQVYHSTFLGNFSGIFSDHLISKDTIPELVRTIFYGALFVLPQCVVLMASGLIGRIGYYPVVRASFIVKILLGLVLYASGPHPALLISFLLLDSAFCSATFSLFNLCLSDIIDDDIKIHRRSYPLSSMVYGNNALVTKPAISIAPMLTVTILNRVGYQDAQSGNISSDQQQELNSAMFVTLCATPVVLGVIQMLVWSRYTLRNSHQTVAHHQEA